MDHGGSDDYSIVQSLAYLPLGVARQQQFERYLVVVSLTVSVEHHGYSLPFECTHSSSLSGISMGFPAEYSSRLGVTFYPPDNSCNDRLLRVKVRVDIPPTQQY